MTRQADESQFYEETERLARRLGGPRRLGDCTARDGWPPHGLYLFFEDGERRGNSTPRVTRVGTHGLHRGSKSTLWGRLAQHRGRVGGSNPGGGNHRGSVFRLHVGAALIARDGLPADLLDSWLRNQRDPAYREREAAVEREVSGYIGKMPLLWLAIPDGEDGTSERGYIERNAIALLSTLAGGNDRASHGWLGTHASNPKIAASGLWNVNHVDEPYDRVFLDRLAAWIDAMPGGAR